MVAWEELSEEMKEMNRYQADDIGIKLHAIGCDILPWSDYGADKFVFTPDEVECMAKLEHERWCKLKLDAGLAVWRHPGRKEKAAPELTGLAGRTFQRMAKRQRS